MARRERRGPRREVSGTREQRAMMAARLSEFMAREGLIGREVREAAATAVIEGRGGPAGTVRALGYVRGAKGSPDRSAYDNAIRAFQRAVTTGKQHQVLSDRYLRELERVATPDERAALRGARAGGVRQRVSWPEGAQVAVVVAGRVNYDERERNDLWAELDTPQLDALVRNPWDTWDSRKGRRASEEGGAAYLPGIVMDRVDDVSFSFVNRGRARMGTF